MKQLLPPKEPQLNHVNWNALNYLQQFHLLKSNPYMAEYLLTRNRSNFFHSEGASLLLYECQHHLSQLYSKKKFVKEHTLQQDTPYYIDPSSRETYSFATEIPCVGNPANISALDPDGSEIYLLTLASLKQHPPAF